MPSGMRWDQAANRERSRRVSDEIRLGRTKPPDYELPVPVHQFELPCGLILGLVVVGGEVRYGRLDRSAGRWRLKMSDWMREELDFEYDRLEREAAEADVTLRDLLKLGDDVVLAL